MNQTKRMKKPSSRRSLRSLLVIGYAGLMVAGWWGVVSHPTETEWQPRIKAWWWAAKAPVAPISSSYRV